MSDKIIFALIGALIGGIASGFFVGCSCCKEYKKKIEMLEEENSRLRKKRRRERDTELKEKERALERAQKIAEEEEYCEACEINFDSEDDVDFDDPFDGIEGDTVVMKKETEKQPSFSIMSQEDFEQDFQFRDSEALTFYQEDHVLADAFDDRIGNAAMIIGEEAIREAEETDDDFLYVMDELEDKMYEIEINHSDSYYRDIIGGGAAK